MGKKPIVHLRVYRGRDLNFDANGKVKNENQSVKFTHDTVEWKNFMRNLIANQYIKVDVDKVLDGDDSKKEIAKGDFQKEVDSYMKAPEKDLTPEQKEIKELKARLDALTGSGKPEKKDKGEEITDELREEYEEVFGKKVYHGWSASEVRTKIDEEKSK